MLRLHKTCLYMFKNICFSKKRKQILEGITFTKWHSKCDNCNNWDVRLLFLYATLSWHVVSRNQLNCHTIKPQITKVGIFKWKAHSLIICAITVIKTLTFFLIYRQTPVQMAADKINAFWSIHLSRLRQSYHVYHTGKSEWFILWCSWFP